jgi:hypothetical protein
MWKDSVLCCKAVGVKEFMFLRCMHRCRGKVRCGKVITLCLTGPEYLLGNVAGRNSGRSAKPWTGSRDPSDGNSQVG